MCEANTLQDRDRIVALLLAGCERANYQKIVALFPAGTYLERDLSTPDMWC